MIQIRFDRLRVGSCFTFSSRNRNITHEGSNAAFEAASFFINKNQEIMSQARTARPCAPLSFGRTNQTRGLVIQAFVLAAQ